VKALASGAEGGQTETCPAAGMKVQVKSSFSICRIQAGGIEVMLDDSRALAETLKKAIMKVKREVFPEMWHIFNCLAGTGPEIDEAIDKCAKWVRPKLRLWTWRISRLPDLVAPATPALSQGARVCSVVMISG
jgi:acetyl esterase/lipase